ncbi:MAG: S41 family peptidase [Gemmatimonadaceae bacterium]
MPRLRTAAAAALFVIPIVAGGFLLEKPPARANALLFQQVMQLVNTQYVDTLPPGATFEKAAEGLVRELNDPYSELLSPKASEDFNRSTGGRYGGTGMLLGDQAPGVVVVDRVFPHTPAEEGGVRAGDRVIAVDSVSTASVPFGKVSDLLRGEPGSPVTVTYARPGVPAPIKLNFKRRVVRVPAVEYSALLGAGKNIGYIPLQTFNENAADEVQNAVDSLVKAGATGIVLDMRDNGGGIVDQALATSSLFLREGQEIVSVRSRNQPTETIKSTGKHLALTIPLVVMVDGGSASATEIVTGALQDHDRALVIGTTSFGKGLVQSVYSLNGGYFLKMTTGKWFTPSGRSIHRERKLLPNGDFVEVHPDSLPSDAPRPAFKSDAGRTVFGGGGIRPDLVIADDTLSTLERGFLLSIALKRQAINTVLADYALELKGSVSSPDFKVPPAWAAEIMRRISASPAETKIDPKYQTTAETFLTHDLENRVTRLTFGDAAAKARDVSEDHPLTKALDLLLGKKTQADLLAAAPAPR